MSETTYPVYEMFHSFQGEGVFAGQSAFFIRLYGCPIHCPWCDSAGTWHANYKPVEGVKRMTADEIVQALPPNVSFVVITGGEPAIHDLSPLLFAIRFLRRAHIETSGGFEIKGVFDWLTVSPKKWKKLEGRTIAKASEFKFIIESPADIESYTQQVENEIGKIVKPVYLHPEWSQRNNKDVLQAITNAVKLQEREYRAGWQLHKLFEADTLDERSKPLVPLGGDERRGY